jgi:hypothetical protein
MFVYQVVATFEEPADNVFGVDYTDSNMGVFSTKQRALDSLRDYCLQYNWEIYSLKILKTRVDQKDEFKNSKVVFDERVEELMTEEECELYGVF